MGLRLIRISASVVIMSVILGCAAPSIGLAGKEKLEAKDWLAAGDLAFKNKDWDNAQYFYELVLKKYPESYYGKKAKENLGYVDYHRSPAGKAVDAGKDALSPIL
jgi:outer membrane protein assembly factor BamD (BamD/ComL family)